MIGRLAGRCALGLTIRSSAGSTATGAHDRADGCAARQTEARDPSHAGGRAHTVGAADARTGTWHRVRSREHGDCGSLTSWLTRDAGPPDRRGAAYRAAARRLSRSDATRAGRRGRPSLAVRMLLAQALNGQSIAAPSPVLHGGVCAHQGAAVSRQSLVGAVGCGGDARLSPATVAPCMTPARADRLFSDRQRWRRWRGFWRSCCRASADFRPPRARSQMPALFAAGGCVL